MKLNFTSTLLHWHAKDNTREMPWKGEKDPYKIWLSEIILQQTRVEQGLAYYNRFISTYPTVFDLAKAKDQTVFKLWEGLGYYNRCRNLLATAKEIVKTFNGKFPNDYETLLTLKGVGPYTAAAIASFAFNAPHAVLDGNVFRVIARYEGIDVPTDTTTGKKIFETRAAALLDKKRAGLYNQAIMDFGATVCKPLAPICTLCPLQKTCVAHATAQVNQLPIKEKQLVKKERRFYYFLLQVNDEIWVTERKHKDIWQGLFEFYLLDAGKKMLWNETTVQQFLKEQLGTSSIKLLHRSPEIKQQLTHQIITAQFIRVALAKKPSSITSGQWQKIGQIKKLPFPKLINQYLGEEFVW
jgi:A/G-specific adenine glycosylase